MTFIKINVLSLQQQQQPRYWPRSVTNRKINLNKHTIDNNEKKKQMTLRHREAKLI